jgi:hypothetical protein
MHNTEDESQKATYWCGDTALKATADELGKLLDDARNDGLNVTRRADGGYRVHLPDGSERWYIPVGDSE